MSFQDMSALFGLDQRQRRLLDLRSYYAETQYEVVTVEGNEVPARPWDKDTDQDGRRIPAVYRKPMLQLGTAAAIVDRLVDLALGQGRFPAIVAEDPATETVRDVMLDQDQLDLEGESPDQLTDLAVVGAACFGFSRPEDDDGFSRWEPLRFAAEWCEPVFAGSRETPRARELAAELETLVELDADELGPLFVMPKGVRSDDVVFVRHKWPVEHEVKAGAHAKEDVTTWYQRDYTIDAIVEYAPVTVRTGDQTAPVFEPLPVEPHNWGVVPLVWLPMRGGSAGDTEGPSIYAPSVRSLTEGADYSASFWTQAAHISGAPVLIEIDVTDEEQDAAVEAGEEPIPNDVAVGPRSVQRYVTNGDHPSVSYLEIDGTGLKDLKDNTETLSKLASERARVPRIDPDTLKGAMSGTAFDRLVEPTIALVGGYRARLERGWKLLTTKLGRAMVVEGEIPSDEGITIDLSWPRVFQLTATDVVAWTQALTGAVGANLTSRKRAVAKLATLLEETADAEDILDEILEDIGASMPTIPEPDDEDPEPDPEEPAE